jgi:hypothetical protein
MRRTVLASIGALVVVATLVWVVSAQLHGQAPGSATADGADKGAGNYVVPRTAWGDPDLQGQWNSQTSTPLERPLTGALAEKETLSDEEAESLEAKHLADGDRPPAEGDPGTYNSFWFDRGKGVNRTSLIIDPPDGRVPAYTPEAAQRLAAERAERATRGPADSYADLPVWTRCITRGWNGIGSNYSSNTQIFQSPGYVVILQELIHEPRIIPIAGPQAPGSAGRDGRDGLPADVRQWLGVSRGRWEGDTLVVETRNFDARASYRGSSPSLVLIERYTRASADVIDYRFTMHDPSTYVKDWTVGRPMRREAAGLTIFEYACHEGNIAMTGILAGARREEKEAAARK